jgi:hypothetical protein
VPATTLESPTDVWRGSGRKCSYCGSMDPAIFMQHIEEGGEITPTDKPYKVYVERCGQKFYFEHLSQEQQTRFIELLNQRKLKIAHPGHFYVLPFFIARVSA